MIYIVKFFGFYYFDFTAVSADTLMVYVPYQKQGLSNSNPCAVAN